MFGLHKNVRMPTREEALPGRAEALPVAPQHYVSGNPIQPPFPAHLRTAMFGMGCFWGAERRFWEMPGVFRTAVGDAGGFTPNPHYKAVCSGQTGHNEVVLVVFDPGEINYTDLLAQFWQLHDPTQGMQQGNDVGTQYRSGIYTFDAQQQSQAESSREHYQQCLRQAKLGDITTEIVAAPDFYYAEDYHQQYLAKNPAGYCGLGGTGINYLPS